MPSPSKKQKKEAEKKEAEKKGAEKKEAEKKEVRRWPGECDDEIPGPFVTIPPQPSRKKPGQLTDEQIHQYFDVVGNHVNREDYMRTQWSGIILSPIDHACFFLQCDLGSTSPTDNIDMSVS